MNDVKDLFEVFLYYDLSMFFGIVVNSSSIKTM